MTIRLLTGDCRELLAGLDPESVDSCVCDPPYHLTSIVKRFGSPTAALAKVGQTGAYARASRGFMGQKWDGGDVAFDPETWAAVLRVLKPGAHLVAFSGTRTYHRMVCAIEDAGFEIRDQLAWIYGSGFPKSHDVAKGLDKLAGERGTFGEAKSAAHQGWIDRGRMRGGEGHEGYQRPWMDDAEAVANNARQYIPATDAAQEFQGWGTALKPAWEPICLARKPLIGTVAGNVLQHGCGAINVDGCRIGFVSVGDAASAKPGGVATGKPLSRLDGREDKRKAFTPSDNTAGRWPANIIHDGSEEVLAGFPDETGNGFRGNPSRDRGSIFGNGSASEVGARGHDDSGSAARFFYCAKATAAERGEGNGHPTVKPVDLMRWLVRLVTPKGGTVLDPFAGSGSTLIAADREQFDAIGMELSAEYAAIAERRLADDRGPLFATERSAA